MAPVPVIAGWVALSLKWMLVGMNSAIRWIEHLPCAAYNLWIDQWQLWVCSLAILFAAGYFSTRKYLLLQLALGCVVLFLADDLARNFQSIKQKEVVVWADNKNTHVRIDGQIKEILPGMRVDRYKNHDIELVIDKLLVSTDDDRRLKSSIGTGMHQGNGSIMEELIFRIEAITRRTKGKKVKEKDTYILGKYVFDTQRQILSFDDSQIKLTTKETELLTLLAANVNEMVERNFALRTIWIDDNYFNARSMSAIVVIIPDLFCRR